MCLRKLENECIKLRINLGLNKYQTQDQTVLAGNEKANIMVSISQFYGIEINDFAVSVAKTALWIAESQMIKQTEEICHQQIDFLPLKTNANIIEGNALRKNWEEIIPKNKLNYIMGNPPFSGARLMSEKQKNDVNYCFEGWKNVGNLDYVSCWYKKAFDYISGTETKCALVSTNSIVQGESVAILFKPLFERGFCINFAYKTFRWDSEANIKAHVHCVIIGFSCYDNKSNKYIYDNDFKKIVKNINGYLLDAENIFVESRKKALNSSSSQMVFGNMPNDSGFLSNISAEEKNAIITKYPQTEKLFRNIYGSEEYINGKNDRYCLWLLNVNPIEYQDIKPIMNRIKNVRDVRIASTRKATNKLADTPHLFGEIRQPIGNYLIIPSTSSENRKYIPIGFLNYECIASNASLIIPNATLYDFGILTSNVHMAWMRAVAGRLEMRYRYSAEIVYNNFPWPNPTKEQKEKIEKTAQAILDARNKYQDSTLAQMYGEYMYLYPELLKAHQENDYAVWEAYKKAWDIKSESNCVKYLFKLYKDLTRNKT